MQRSCPIWLLWQSRQVLGLSTEFRISLKIPEEGDQVKQWGSLVFRTVGFFRTVDGQDFVPYFFSPRAGTQMQAFRALMCHAHAERASKYCLANV